ncbi:hypothetical protein I41_47740 [Lacipirellula limnantheis]|uniref:Uncharacterized protein n=1 Tax=Lacipirellula limnantheis TaxID=2528024 RepID=A0A517U4K3_9BACT|nr:hypothetical protein I41_47740 [Lacipirellula limnantheis]
MPIVLSAPDRVVLWCGGPEFTQLPRMAKRTMLNVMDAQLVQAACDRFTAESKTRVLFLTNSVIRDSMMGTKKRSNLLTD